MSNKDANWLDKDGRIDFEILEEGARRNAEKRAEEQRIIKEKEIAKQQAKDKELNDLLSKVADKITADNKAKADDAIAKEMAQAEAEIREKHNKLHNVKNESATDKAWREWLNGLKG